MLSVIENRRSIRKYKDTPVAEGDIRRVLEAARLAPSSKNGQPWYFIVAQETAKGELVAAMKAGMEREQERPLLPESARHLPAAAHTLAVMEQAPVVILVVNPLAFDPVRHLTVDERIGEVCNAQSLGAALENMSLAATALGLGSLWICDTYFAYPELNRWADTEGQVMAAMALGYAAEAPAARPRKKWRDTVAWRK